MIYLINYTITCYHSDSKIPLVYRAIKNLLTDEEIFALQSIVRRSLCSFSSFIVYVMLIIQEF